MGGVQQVFSLTTTRGPDTTRLGNPPGRSGASTKTDLSRSGDGVPVDRSRTAPRERPHSPPFGVIHPRMGAPPSSSAISCLPIGETRDVVLSAFASALRSFPTGVGSCPDRCGVPLPCRGPPFLWFARFNEGGHDEALPRDHRSSNDRRLRPACPGDQRNSGLPCRERRLAGVT